MFRETIVKVFSDLDALVRLLPHAPRFAAQEACERQSTQSNRRGSVLDEFPIEQSDLHEESSDVLHFWVFHAGTTAHESEPGFGGGMTESPLYGGKDVALHLKEGRLLVGVMAHLNEILHCGHPLLCIFELRGNPECSTSDELVVLNVDNAAGNVAIDDVESEIQSFRTQAKTEVDLDQKVDETRSHMPPNLGLLIHGLRR